MTGMMAGFKTPGRMRVISLIQRVSEAQVTVDGAVTGRIGRGLLVLLAVQPDDDSSTVTRMAERVIGYRIFPDDQ